MAVDHNRTGSDVEEARQKAHEGGLPCSAGPDDGNNLSGFYFQIDVAENLPSSFLVVVPKIDGLEANAVFERGQCDGVRLVVYVILHFHEIEDRRGSDECLLKVVVELREFSDGIVELKNSHDEGEKRAFGHKAAANAVSSN